MTIRGIIYTPDREIGRSKLLDIEKEKNSLGIATTLKRFSNYVGDEIKFADGEIWKVVKPDDTSRGCRWNKAWVDKSNVTEEQLQYYIIPTESRYFN